MANINFLSNFLFLWKRPKVVIVTGKGRKTAKEAIYQVLKQYFKVGKEILLFESDLENLKELKKFKFLAKNSSLPILILTNIGDIPSDKDSFSANKEKTGEIQKLVRILPFYGYLILNFDDETVREIKDGTNLKKITFGFQEGADFRATDIKLNSGAAAKGEEENLSSLTSGTNFKIDYKGNIVPVWLEKLFGKEEIYASLSAFAVGVMLDLNLVEISQLLKNYRGFTEKGNDSQRG